MAAASRSPSGGKSPDGELRSFLYGPGLRILAGVGLGYISHRLWAGPQDALDSKLAQLRAAPTVDFNTVHSRQIPREGELVVLQNGVVCSVGTLTLKRKCQSDTCHAPRSIKQDWLHDVVAATKPVKSYAETRVPNQHVCGVFGLCEGAWLRLRQPCVVVKNVDADHLPLEINRVVNPVQWPSRQIKAEVGWTRFLRKETMFRSVFGRLTRNENGVIEIEPCSEFPKDCFTKRKSEIKKVIQAQAETDPSKSRVRTWSVGVGFVSLWFILSGIYPNAIN